MEREGIFRTRSKRAGRARRKVNDLPALLRSERFADVVDVNEFHGGRPLLVPAGSPAPLPSPAFADVAASWLHALPSGKRAKMEAALSAAATPHAKWELLKASAEGDHTNARVTAKQAVLAWVLEAANLFRN